MAKLMRMLSKTDRTEWTAAASKWPDWCPTEEVPAHLLADWCDDDLSLWKIENDNLDLILAAMIEMRGSDFWKSGSCEYLLFDEDVIAKSSLVINKCQGTLNVKTLDAKYHYEVNNFSSGNLEKLILSMITALKSSNADIVIMKKKEWVAKKRQEIESKCSAGTATEPLRAPVEASTAQGDLPNPPGESSSTGMPGLTAVPAEKPA